MEKNYAFFKPLDVLENFENLPEVKATAEYKRKAIDKVGEKIKNQTSVASKFISKATDSYKNNAFEFTKENINNGLNAMGNVLGVDEKLTASSIIKATSASIENIIGDKKNCDQETNF